MTDNEQERLKSEKYKIAKEVYSEYCEPGNYLDGDFCGFLESKTKPQDPDKSLRESWDRFFSMISLSTFDVSINNNYLYDKLKDIFKDHFISESVINKAKTEGVAEYLRTRTEK